MKIEYSYPLRSDWTTEEIIQVVEFFELIERAFDTEVERKEMMEAYRIFKKIVPSKAEEKTLFAEFEKASGHKSYSIIKMAREAEDGEMIQGAQR